MTETVIHPVVAADALSVGLLDLAKFLRDGASDWLLKAAEIAANDTTWHPSSDMPQRFEEIDELVAGAKRLIENAYVLEDEYDRLNPSGLNPSVDEPA